MGMLKEDSFNKRERDRQRRERYKGRILVGGKIENRGCREREIMEVGIS